MIVPNKHLFLQNSILNYICQILKYLLKRSYSVFDLYNVLKNEYSALLFTDFLYALDILKAMNKIQYKNKMLEIVK